MLVAIFQTWSKFHLFSPTDENDIKEETLWRNKHVTIGNESFCWPTWLNAGIVCVNDILHPTLPRFLSHEEITTT